MNWFTLGLFSKIYYFLILLFLVIFGGTIGYFFIEDWTVIDSFYMTIITVSTVGFQEVHSLSTGGKLFTAILIVTSFGTFAYAITSITSYLVGGKYRKFIKERKLMKDLSTMQNHVVICGYGRVGKQVAEDLASVNTPFVILENNAETIAEDEDKTGYIFLKGDATQEELLERANLAKARAIITCLPKDADNVYVVLAARERLKTLLIVARASAQSAVSKLKMAGANNVILPDTIGGSHMASLIANPDVMEFLDIVRVQGTGGANINSVAFSELPEELQNKTIGQLEAKRITGVTIIGFKTPDGLYLINPDNDIKMVPHSKLFVLGSSVQIQKLKDLFGLKH